MNEAEFRLHPEAAQDITDIWEYIASDSLQAARRVREGILEAIRNVVQFPHRGHRRPDLTTRPSAFYSRLELPDCLCTRETPLGVIAVVPGKRRPRVMAAIPRGRELPE